jgi:hypothetical protein
LASTAKTTGLAHAQRAAGAAEETVVRFQINQGWLVGQFLIPHGTVIDGDGKQDYQLTEAERLARGRTPPLDSTALDYDCALTLWRAFPEHRHRLRRSLSPFDRETFERLAAADEASLERHWPRGAG